MKNFILGLFLMLGGFLSYGQEITGKVVDANGQPIPDVYITADASGTSTTADLDGNFTIQAQEGETLTFTMLGFETLTATAAQGMSVSLAPSESSMLEEVVVIGYGAQRKADVTGSIATVKEEDLRNRPNANPLSSVQGKVPGVLITNSGAPGAAPGVSIRGLGSISGNNPLYVVDGVLTDNITYINPNDIESISILKDASSSAIYGIRAANGVIIITTKLGRKTGVENIKFTYDSNIGITVPTNVLELANAQEYIQLYNEKLAYEGADPSNYISADQFNNVDTNWYDEILKKNAITQSHNVSMQGASEKSRYNMALGYFTQEGILEAGRNFNSGNDYERITARFNGVYDVSQSIRIGGNIAYYTFNTNDSQTPFQQARIAPPLLPVYNQDGDYGTLPDSPSLGTFANPRATLDFFRGKSKGTRTLISGFGEIDLIKELTFKTSYSRDFGNVNNYTYTPEYFVTNSQRSENSILTKRNDTDEKLLWENTLTFTKEIDKHRFVVLAGYSIQQNSTTAFRAAAQDVPFYGDDSTLHLNLGTAVTSAMPDNEEGSKTRFQSYFGRLQYAFDDKYLLNATVRRDGTSAYNFNGDQRSATFPSIGIGWIISEENFMANSGFDFLKLKASWGRLGNASITRQFDQTATVQRPAFFGTPSQVANAISFTQLVDPSINWEVVEEFDLGVELRTFANRLTFEAGYYNRETTDAVFAVAIPSQAGLGTSFFTNAGSFENKGFEVSLNWEDTVNDKFKYNIYGNFTTIDNQITEVLGGSFLNTGPGLFGNPIKRWEVGQEIGSYYGYQVEGVVQTPEEAAAYGSPVGSLKFADLDSNGVIDENDKTFLGSPIPNVTYGFGFGIEYASVDFAMDFQGVAGNEIYNFNRNARFGNENWDKDFVDNRWTPDNPSNTYPAPNSDQQSSRPSSFYVEKGDYFRIRNIQLGYTIPQTFMGKAGIDRLRVYVSAQNPFTSFDYNGFSPELGNQNVENMGIDNNVYPLSAVYSFGVNLNF